LKELYGFDMEFTMVPAQDTYQRDMLEFAGGSSSMDIVLFQPAWMADYAGHLLDLNALASKYNLNFHLDDVEPLFGGSSTTWEGRLVALPFDGDQFNFYINKTAFEDQRNKDAFKEKTGKELKVPETWEDYAEVANFFAGRDWDFDGEPEYGVSEAWLRGGYAFWWWSAKFLGYGGLWFDENMKPLINGPSGQKAMEIQLAIAGAVPPGATNFGSGEARNAWLVGDAPMVYHWTSSAKLAMDPEKSKIVDSAWVTLVPGVKDGDKIHRLAPLPTGWVMGITKYSKNPEAAARLMEFLVEPERSKAIALEAAFWCEPWRKSSFAEEVWKTKWPDHVEYGVNLAKVMKDTLAIGVPDLQIPGQDEYVKALDAEISAVMIGEKSAQAALDAAAKEWEAITDRLGREEQKKWWKIQADALAARGIVYRPDLAK